MARGSVSHITTGLWRTLAIGCVEMELVNGRGRPGRAQGADRGTSKQRTASLSDQKRAVNGETSRRWTVSSPKTWMPD